MIIYSDEVYEPREDSYLLQSIIERYAAGKVLEIGVGSGILTKTAASMQGVEHITGIDINRNAITATQDELKKQHIPKKKYRLIKSDLFEKIDEKYDTIIFNPPYLPDDPKVKDPALDGGKQGYELIQRFIENVNPYLSMAGAIFLLFSSYSRKNMIEKFIQDQELVYFEIERKNIDNEILYVYRIEKSPILRELEAQGMKEIKKFLMI